MPLAHYKSVFCVSSEDKAHPANNLLLNTNKKWKCQLNGESMAYVILQFEQPSQIIGIDIGNEHAAYIEVQVGKHGWPQENYQQILLTSSFMSPTESRNSTLNNRVRCFGKDALISPVCDDKWDLIKLVCTQPFNKHVQYGLSFLKVHCTDGSLTKPATEKPNWMSSATMFGKFKLREESPDSDRDDGKAASTLFSKWRQEKSSPAKEAVPKATSKMSAAAAIREASKKPTASKYSPAVAKIEPPRPRSATKQRRTKDTNEDEDKNEERPHDRNRHNLMYDEEDDTKSIPKLEKQIVKDRERIEKEKNEVKAKNSKPSDQQRDTNGTNLSGTRDSSKKMEASTNKFKDFVDADGKENNNRPKVTDTPKSERKANGASTSTSGSSASPRPTKNIELHVDAPQTGGMKRLSSPMRHHEPVAKKKKTPSKISYKPYDRLLEGVVLVISGIQNPERADIRDKALRMGARYKPDWDNTCTHLICAFKNTPKYNQVKSHGKIVKKDWIIQCDSHRKRIPWRRHAVDSSDMDQPESEEEIWDQASQDGDISDDSSSSMQSSTHARSSLNMNDSDLEDGAAKGDEVVSIYDVETDEDSAHDADPDPDISQVLGTIFVGKLFYLNGNVGAVDEIKLRRLVVENGGSVCARATDADYVISKGAYDEAGASLKGAVVTPLWVYESSEMNQLLPTTRYKL